MMGNLPEVIMYSTTWCGYCQRARGLLERKGVGIREIKVDEDPSQREVMVQKSGRRTVPQIFIGERHVGGYDDLAALERAGELDKLLAPVS
jgi:glutaredoxin 3